MNSDRQSLHCFASASSRCPKRFISWSGDLDHARVVYTEMINLFSSSFCEHFITNGFNCESG